MSEVAVVGAGYVGLTTAACLARLGHSVTCADLDQERVRALSKGEVPILEEGLPALVAEGLAAGRLRFVVGATNGVRVPVRADAAVGVGRGRPERGRSGDPGDRAGATRRYRRDQQVDHARRLH